MPHLPSSHLLSPLNSEGKVAPSGESPELPTSAEHKPAVARRQASEKLHKIRAVAGDPQQWWRGIPV